MTIGLIGTGLMGAPMAARLHAAGVPTMVWNRSSDKLASLQAQGVAIAPSLPHLFQETEAVLLMVSDARAIRSLLFSEDVSGKLSGGTLVQMGTIGPNESRALQTDTEAAGGHYLEAPVLGSIPQVEAGTLQIMVGSTPEQFETWRSLLQHLGEPQHIGPVGSAAALKLALNQLIASLTTAFSQSLAFVQEQGVDVETFMGILRESALYASTFDKKLDRMLNRDFANPNFPTRHMLKDVRLFLAEAQAAGVRVDSLEGIRQILEDACAQAELVDADYSALFAAVYPQKQP
ncbi:MULTISPECIES: NAD(P)-dependent oxidoreductase [unclassified Leptolyngbya]|uniref:NAD(P)-dependent oxidoreductase n=1 Tax=unclassified Leptolyngbya TaxID=2650499 RepID=UPI0016866470|nr:MULTISPECIES: NAD(P)-dependent oxidoreductase [unclassified Leptolyngbya]MBD1912178.1 NAD(P)-dependent oxidoreductase [Leptolyngbya sp. FACHB-8]MBD2155069.1 NAD(P)-dependent oxidoreductase [Leptolyngbya sp. FACHB-16]